jgi:hypothetical protein
MTKLFEFNTLITDHSYLPPAMEFPVLTTVTAVQTTGLQNPE